MKKTTLMSVLTLCLTTLVAHAAVTAPATSGIDSSAGAPPPTTQAESTADGATWVSADQMKARAVPHASGNPVAIIKHTLVLLPDSASPDWQTAADKVIAAALAGTLPTQTNDLVNPGDYSIAQSIWWYNLVSEPTNRMELWDLSDVQSVSGNNDVDLADYVLSFTSSDGGVLSGSLTFNTASYTPRAPLIVNNGDGTVKTNTTDAATQKGKRFLVLAHAKQFAGGSQSALTADKTWVANHDTATSRYTVTFTGQWGNDSLMTQISTVPVVVNTGFSAGITNDGLNSYIWINGGNSNLNYEIQASDTLENPNWSSVTAIHGFDHATIANPPDRPYRFFRALVQ